MRKAGLSVVYAVGSRASDTVFPHDECPFRKATQNREMPKRVAKQDYHPE